MPILPENDCSLLVRTDFTSDDAWQQVADEATRENEDGFQAGVEPVSDPAFDRASWETVKEAVSPNGHSGSVLFIADSISLSSPDHPILVVDLSDTFLSVAEFPEIVGQTPFRCIPSELWSVENNLNLANMDWEDFAEAVGEDDEIPVGCFPGTPPALHLIGRRRRSGRSHDRHHDMTAGCTARV